MGRDQRRLQQHVHVLHRAQPARQGDRPRAGRHPRRGRGAGRRRRAGGDPARAERQLRTASRSATGRVRQAAPRLRRRRGSGRVRFTSPHPKDFTDDVIEAMAETPNVMPSLHMPLQSGLATACCGRCAARTGPQRYLGILDRVREAIPRRRDHDRHHRGVPRRDRGRLRSRPSTSSAGPVQRRVHLPVLDPTRDPSGHDARPGAAARWSRTGTSAWSSWSTRSPGGEPQLVGSEVEVMFAEGEGRKDAATPCGCRDGRGTTGWSTSRCPTTALRPGPATSPSCDDHATPPRTTWWLTGGPTDSTHPRRRRVGGPPARVRAGESRLGIRRLCGPPTCGRTMPGQPTGAAHRKDVGPRCGPGGSMTEAPEVAPELSDPV